jgi:predicted kinase
MSHKDEFVDDTRPVCYMFVGAPCTGKSTHYEEEFSYLPRASSDEFIMLYAKLLGRQYDEVFKEYAPTAMIMLNKQIANLIANRESFVWDQTNMTVKGRASKLRLLKDYRVVAVIFERNREVHRRWYEARTDKFVSWNIIESMLNTYQRPTMEEGFCSLQLLWPDPEGLAERITRGEDTINFMEKI